MHGEPPWPRFVKHLNRSFGLTIQTSQLAEIKHLKQTSTVKDYKKQFLTFVCRCDSLTDEQQVELFIAGLRNPIRTDVDLQYPTSLEAAMSLALAYERRGLSDEDDNMPTAPAKGTAIRASKPSVPVVAAPLAKTAPTAPGPVSVVGPPIPGQKPFK
jgi:hypothetical protein